jgi:hypothetical protein
MIEHLVILLIEAMARKEKAEQQVALDVVIAELDHLHSDPAAALAEGDVVIPAARHGPLALLLGVVLGLGMCALMILAFAVIRPHVPLAKPLPRSTRQAIALAALPIMAGFVALGYAIARRSLRGGELTLKRAGAEFRYRHTTVFCPWTLFRVEMSAMQGDNRKVILLVPPHAIDRVELRWRDGVVGIGRDARIKPIRFISETELELTNVYAANLRDVARLLLRIGSRLG